MVDAADMYALTGESAWIDFFNPGFHRHANGTFNPVAQRNTKAIFNAAITVYTSQQNVKGAVNDALNRGGIEGAPSQPQHHRSQEFLT